MQHTNNISNNKNKIIIVRHIELLTAQNINGCLEEQLKSYIKLVKLFLLVTIYLESIVA